MNGSVSKTLRMTLDAVMTLLLVLLMKLSFTGLALHELVGLFLFVFFVLHKLINYKWIVSVFKKLFSRNTSNKLRFMFILDFLLLIGVTALLVSGIAISQVVFPHIQINDLEAWSDWHHFSAYVSLILTSVHIGMHWQAIMGFVKKMLRIKSISFVRTLIIRCFALFLAFIGIKGLTNPYIKQNLTAPFKKASERNQKVISSSDIKKEHNTAQILNSPMNLATESPSLEEYLGNLFCSGCPRRCSLLRLGCGRGTAYKNQAINEYNALYAQESANATESENESENESKKDNKSSVSSEVLEESSETVVVIAPLTEEKAGLHDYIGIMSLMIGGTYYTLQIPKFLSKNKETMDADKEIKS